MGDLRTRMLVAFVGLLAVATLASVLIARQVLESRLEERIAAELQQEVDELRKTASAPDPATGRPFGSNVRRLFRTYFTHNAFSQSEAALSFVAGKPFLRSPNHESAHGIDPDNDLLLRWSSLRTPERGSADTGSGRFDYLAVPVMSDGKLLGAFVAAKSRDAERDALRQAYFASTAVGLTVLLIGSLLAWRMADSILRPVEAITTAARGISESDLTRRIDVRGRGEVAALAATFNAMLDRLEQAFGSQRQFLDDAGHELRTPITIIRGHLELLEDDPGEREGTLALVLDELDRMGRMVNELILLAKAERPDFLQRTPLDVASLTGEFLTKAEALGPRGWVLDAEGHGTVVADRQRLTQAIMQLAQNAVAHTSEGQQVGMGSAVDMQAARFWVRDSGSGIALQDQSAIFERFERRGPRSREGGSGLGLAIVRAIAEAHGGHVTVESEPGHGATFTVQLPLNAGGDRGRRGAWREC